MPAKMKSVGKRYQGVLLEVHLRPDAGGSLERAGGVNTDTAATGEILDAQKEEFSDGGAGDRNEQQL